MDELPEKEASELYGAIITLCQGYGYTTDASYDKAQELVDTVRIDPEEEED